MPDHRTILISGAERFWQVRHPDAHRACSPMARVWPASGNTEDRSAGTDASKPENILRVSTATLSMGKPALLSRRSEEHTSELQSLMRISYAVFCLKKKT